MQGYVLCDNCFGAGYIDVAESEQSEEYDIYQNKCKKIKLKGKGAKAKYVCDHCDEETVNAMKK